jgi:hypothetical protein
MIPVELQPFVGVGVLAVVFVFVASLIHKYRLWQAEKMAKARKLLRGVKQIEVALEKIANVALPRSVVRLFKAERLLRYQKVLQLVPQYAEMNERLQQLERSHESEGGDPGWDPPALTEARQVASFTAGLTGLVTYLTEEQVLSEDFDANAAKLMREQLRTLRAEIKARFHSAVATEAAQQGNWEIAKKESLLLLNYLKTKAPPNEQGRALYQQAMDLYRHFSHKKLPSGEPGH